MQSSLANSVPQSVQFFLLVKRIISVPWGQIRGWQITFDPLSIPAMSAETERVFSDMQHYLSRQRC